MLWRIEEKRAPAGEPLSCAYLALSVRRRLWAVLLQERHQRLDAVSPAEVPDLEELAMDEAPQALGARGRAHHARVTSQTLDSWT